MYFVDTSALVKAYIAEPLGTRTLLDAFRALGGSSLYVSTLVAAETLAVLARELRKRNLRKREYEALRDDLSRHLASVLHVVEVSDALVRRSLVLVDAYREKGVGAADMIHVATAEHLRRTFPRRPLGFMCSDAALKAVVNAHGIGVFDPETDPPLNLLPPD